MLDFQRSLARVFSFDNGNADDKSRPRFRIEFLPREPAQPLVPEGLLVACCEGNVARLIEVNLVRQGWRVETVGTAAEALWRIRQRPPALFVCDAELPPANGGLELVATIRRDSALTDLPVVLLLPKGADGDMARRAREVTDAVLTKPFNPLEMVTHARRILRPVSDSFTIIDSV